MPNLIAPEYVLAVHSCAEISDYFQKKLGFTENFALGDDWRFLSRGACKLRLGQCVDAIHPQDLGDHSYFAYVIVDDVRDLHAEFKQKGAILIHDDPIDQPWGHREFGVRTPEGHRMMFAQILN
ncbi:MAG: VOC family protein [Fimbriimonadaceae bacterium]